VALTPAFATVWSGQKYFTSNGISYQNASYGADSQYVGTTLDRNDHGQATEGKMGAQARIYFDQGVLCQASTFEYNTVSTTHFTVDMLGNCGGWIFSQGRTHTWNGNGYDSVPTYRTPDWLE
jgi:hypothetical protein